MTDMFMHPAVCAQCGSFVLDEKQHQAFHDAIKNALIEHANAVQRVLEKAEFERKRPERPRPPMSTRWGTASAGDVPGGICRGCGGCLVIDPTPKEVDAAYKKVLKVSDSTVPYLVCIDCGREIRRG